MFANPRVCCKATHVSLSMQREHLMPRVEATTSNLATGTSAALSRRKYPHRNGPTPRRIVKYAAAPMMQRADLATPRFRGYRSIERRSKTLLPPAVLRRGRYDPNFIVHQAANVCHNCKRPTIEDESALQPMTSANPSRIFIKKAWNALATTE